MTFHRLRIGEDVVGPAASGRRGPAERRLRRGGPADGPAVVLLHGWPYDIHTFAEVSPLLAAAGYRVIVPYLRGYGTTRFLSDETFRNGQQSVLAVDADRVDGRPRDREGDRRRLRLGSADGRHRRGALAGALQGARLRERVSDRQPAGRQAAVAAGGRAAVVVPVLLRHRARPGRLRASTGASSRSSSGGPPRRSGTSTTPRSSAAQRRSTTRITSRS